MTIQELLRGLRVDFLESGHHHCRAGWLQIEKCPFCSSDNYHLGYNLQGKFFTCWRCRWHHAIPTLLELGASVKEAKEFFTDNSNRQILKPEWEKPTNRKLKTPKFVEPLAKPHRRYLEGRKFDPDEIATVWNVGGIGMRGHLKWRLYIPIYLNGVQVSWTTRSVGKDAKQRYLSAAEDEEIMNHKHVVYGLDFCTQTVIAVEGPTDAWAIGPGAGGMFGTAFTSQQVAALARFPRRFVCFDAASPAQRTARELCERLSVLPGTTENIVLDAKDPGSASKKELAELREYCGI